ncbi:hypothetical protein KVT40_004780 [Elsinoe batatas]|uniref:U three protein 7 n=1 Tax=Elsinoe batatas TaxID=2601811 RepID=A0A8K0L1E0_9PEZI|nr:hypothetical protein KVT40_004780 [Elsinoe batatas]
MTAPPSNQTSLTRLSRPNEDPSAEVRRRKAHLASAQQSYGRGSPVAVRNIRDKKLRGNLRQLEQRYQDAALQAKDAEILHENSSGFLEAEGELEKTYKVSQSEIKQSVGVETAKKGFELRLDELGPYTSDYTRNGRELLLAGRKGHVAAFDWREGKLGCEMQLGETVRDAKWLHNNQFFAVAQKRSVYIYDSQGVELHNLTEHIDPLYMQFLPYHFLLATVGNAGWIKWHDTSIGKLVAQTGTKQGTPTSMTLNPWNAVSHVGHQNGTISLWAPSSSTALVKMLCHRGPVRSMAIDRSGNYMVSTGQDMKMAVWDIRTFKEIHSYTLRRPGTALSISDRNLTAVGWGTQTTIWKDLFVRSPTDIPPPKPTSPYMSFPGAGSPVQSLQWCPFEDVLGISHSAGFTSALVPGAGEPNYDALEANPYENAKQRQESEVKSLLNKLQPEMISLNPNFIGDLDLASHEQRQKERDLDRDEKEEEKDQLEKLKNRGRGKNSSLRKFLRKKGGRNIVDERKVRVMEMREGQKRERRRRLEGAQGELGPALGRFAGKG